MSVEIVQVYRFACDWPACRSQVTIHGASSMVEALSRIRRDGWTFTDRPRARRPDASATREVRCPVHAYLFARKPTGRPRLRSEQAA